MPDSTFFICNEETLKPLKNNSNKNINSNVEKVPPDGGWGWMVVLGGIITLLIGAIPMHGFSFLFSPILMSHGVSSFKTSWIYNLKVLTSSLASLFVGPLCDEFGYRNVGLFGGLTVFVSMILSAFATSPDLLFFSYSLLGGIGEANTIVLPLFIVSKYFEKRRGLATGITLLGSSGSSFISPLIPNYLLHYYDYKGASLISAAIVLNQCVGATLYQPVEWHMKPSKEQQLTEKILNEEKNCEDRSPEDKNNLEALQITPTEKCSNSNDPSSCFADWKTQSRTRKLVSEIQINRGKINFKTNQKKFELTKVFIRVLKLTYKNFKSLKFTRVQIIALAYCSFIIGFLNFQMWIPFILTNAGYTLESAAWCSSFSFIGNLIGLLVTSVLSDKKFFNVRYGYMSGLFLTGCSIIVFSIIKDIILYNILVCIWGFGVGLSVTLLSICMIHVMGIEMFPAVFGVSRFLQGFVGILIRTLSGAVQDATLDFTYTSIILGGCVQFGFCLWLLMPYAERIDKKLYRKDKNKMSGSFSPVTAP